MKKIFLLPVLALALGACSNENNLVPEEPETSLEGKVTGYVNVQIVMPSSIGTRAYEGQYKPDEDQDATYVDGSTEENRVNNVRFYFFNKNYGASEIRKNPNPTTGGKDYYSFIDWTPAAAEIPTEPKPDSSETVEQQYTTTLALSQPNYASEDDKPYYVVAIVNPSVEIMQLIDNPSFETLNNVMKDYVTGLTNIDSGKGNFVMSNSVFYEGTTTKNLMNCAEISIIPVEEDPSGKNDSNTWDTPTPDKLVTIYVERVAARIDFLIDLTNSETQNYKEENIYKIGRDFDPQSVIDYNETLTKEEIYLQVLGWQLASFPSESYLIKHIDLNWTDNNFFGKTNEPWNASSYHRSFWAMNPASDKMKYNFYSYDQIIGANGYQKVGNPASVSSGYNSIYTQENANPATSEAKAPEAATEVIFVGKLGTMEEGNFTPKTMCEYRGKQYTEEGLKHYLCRHELNMYRNTGTEEKPEWTKVTAEDLKFITQTQWLELGNTVLDPANSGSQNSGQSTEPEVSEKNDPMGLATRDDVKTSTPSSKSAAEIEALVDNRYYSYLVLSDKEIGDDGKKYTPSKTEWYHLEAPATYKKISNIPQYIYNSLNYAKIKVWKDGMTYFFHKIKHLGAKDNLAEFGVVRNHIYNVKFTTIAGFGTPVYDPQEPIYPETPENQPDDLEVTIKILSWRLVSQEYEVNW